MTGRHRAATAYACQQRPRGRQHPLIAADGSRILSYCDGQQAGQTLEILLCARPQFDPVPSRRITTDGWIASIVVLYL